MFCWPETLGRAKSSTTTAAPEKGGWSSPGSRGRWSRQRFSGRLRRVGLLRQISPNREIHRAGTTVQAFDLQEVRRRSF